MQGFGSGFQAVPATCKSRLADMFPEIVAAGFTASESRYSELGLLQYDGCEAVVRQPHVVHLKP